MEQVMSNEQTNGQIRLYCLGGAGIGIGRYFEPERNKSDAGYAQLSPVYMDTSKASIFNLDEEHFYHLPEKEGSGGVRAYNGPDIIRYTGEMLDKFKPFKHNIVIHSTTGGSGSVMGPSIVSELLARGLSVIVICVGGDDTLNYINNTIGTMESYENISRHREAPVVMQFFQNGKDGRIEDVDAKIRLTVACLTVLFSGQNTNLDDRDLFNFLHFDRVTSYQPQVSVLTVHQGRADFSDDANLISVATLNADLNDTRLNQPVEFQRVGIPTNVLQTNDDLKFPLHYVISDGYLDSIMKVLRKQRVEYETKANARVVRNQLGGSSSNAQSNGVTF